MESKFLLNEGGFGYYCEIEQKNYGVDNDMFIHKIVTSGRSNSWIDVPVKMGEPEKLHNKMEDVLWCITCGVCEDKVKRYRVSDVKNVKPISELSEAQDRIEKAFQITMNRLKYYVNELGETTETSPYVTDLNMILAELQAPIKI